MIAISALSFTLRNILDRAGQASTRRRISLASGISVSRWWRALAALKDWSTVSNLTWRGEIPLPDQPDRVHRFCRNCGEETPHHGFDEFGAGWYAQICRCRYCGEEGMRVWPLALY
jgi:hypothetical protein